MHISSIQKKQIFKVYSRAICASQFREIPYEVIHQQGDTAGCIQCVTYSTLFICVMSKYVLYHLTLVVPKTSTPISRPKRLNAHKNNFYFTWKLKEIITLKYIMQVGSYWLCFCVCLCKYLHRSGNGVESKHSRSVLQSSKI